MSARDDLAEIIRQGIHNQEWGLDSHDIADEILAAGFHRDRIIETEEELDALAEGSIVRDSCGITLTKDYESWYTTRVDDPDEVELPATVLWEPGDDDE